MVSKRWLTVGLLSALLAAGCVQPTPTPTFVPPAATTAATAPSLSTAYPASVASPTVPAPGTPYPAAPASTPYPAATTGAALKHGALARADWGMV